MDGPGVARQGSETDRNRARKVDRRRLLYNALPLDHTKKQFRLLELYKDADCKKLRGRLIVRSLDSHPRFNGLAYTLDTSCGETDLELNQKRIWIPTTLYHALESLRYQFRTEPTNERFTSVLWVEPICVNEDNPAERSALVAILPEIHRRPSDVLLFLGRLDSVAAHPIKAI